MKTYIIDLDETLAISISPVPGDFEHNLDWQLEHKVCNQDLKDKIIKAKDKGNRIIIYSARSDTDWRMRQTREWLEKNDVPYNQIILGKPKGDKYIDNDSLRAEEWNP